MLSSFSRSGLLIAAVWPISIVLWAVLEFSLNETTPPRAYWVFRDRGYMVIDWMRVAIAALAPVVLILLVSWNGRSRTAAPFRLPRLPPLGLLVRLWVIAAIAWCLNIAWHVFVEWANYNASNQFADLVLRRDWFVPATETDAPRGTTFGKPLQFRFGKLFSAALLPLVGLAVAFRWALHGLRDDIGRATARTLPAGGPAGTADDGVTALGTARFATAQNDADRATGRVLKPAKFEPPVRKSHPATQQTEPPIPQEPGGRSGPTDPDNTVRPDARTALNPAVAHRHALADDPEQANLSEPPQLTRGDWVMAVVSFLLTPLFPAALAVYNLLRGARVRAKLYAIVLAVQVLVLVAYKFISP